MTTLNVLDYNTLHTFTVEYVSQDGEIVRWNVQDTCPEDANVDFINHCIREEIHPLAVRSVAIRNGRVTKRIHTLSEVELRDYFNQSNN